LAQLKVVSTWEVNVIGCILTQSREFDSATEARREIGEEKENQIEK